MIAFNVYLEKALLCTQVVIQGFTLMGKCPQYIQLAKYSQGAEADGFYIFLFYHTSLISTVFFYDCRWYKMDENCFPVSYILQPVTTWIPNFLNDSCDLSQKEEAQKKWESEYNMMKEFLQQAAKEVLNDEDIWQKYVISGKLIQSMQFLCCS